MTIRIRPHHLFCLLTYKGYGYTPSFIENFDRIAERISKGEDIILVAGPDDICMPMLEENNPHCLKKSIQKRDKWAYEYLKKKLSLDIHPGISLTLTEKILQNLRNNFAETPNRKPCKRCKWKKLCDQIALEGFSNVKVNHKNS